MITFPLWPVIDGKCGCGNELCKGKHPKRRWKDIRETIEGDPGDGVGIPTGAVNDIFVVDIDEKNGVSGSKNLEALGELPETYTTRTPTGGYHLYFKHPGVRVANSASKIAKGVDIRGDGGYVRQYDVIHDAPIAAAPEWLLKMIRAPTLREIVDDSPRTVPAEADKTLDASMWLNLQEPCVEGQGGQARLWGVCRGLTLDFAQSEDDALFLLGSYNERCSPPWSVEELTRTLHRAARSEYVKAPAWFEALSAQKTVGEPAPIDYAFTPGTIVTNGEKKKCDLESALDVLRNNPEWLGVLRFDVFAQRITAINPPVKLDAEPQRLGFSDNDITLIRAWFQAQGLLLGHDECDKAVRATAKANEFHPVKDYLESLPASSASLDNIATEIFGDDGVANEMLKRTLVGAVRRIYEPGCQHDTILVLFGPQGIGKSTFCRRMFGEWFRDQIPPDIGNRDASMALRAVWGIEFGELDRLQKEGDSTLKDFISRPVDRYRAFSRSDDVTQPRQCVFIATTNKDDFLVDHTGERRYLPISVLRKVETITEERRAEIWATALELYREGYPSYFDMNEAVWAQVLQKHEGFKSRDPWFEFIFDYCHGETEVTVKEIWEKLDKNKDVSKLDSKTEKRIVKSLKQIGCENKRRYLQRFWVVPEGLKAERVKVVKMRIIPGGLK